MKEGVTFNYASLKVLGMFTYKHFGGGGRKEPENVQRIFSSLFLLYLQTLDPLLNRL